MKQKLKICSPQLGLSKNSNLGGEIHDAFLLESLAKKGVIIYIILPKKRDFPKHKNIIPKFLPFNSIFPPFLFNFLILPHLFKIYQKNKFQLLRIHSPYFVGPAAIIFKKFIPSIKLIATYHHLENNPFFNFLDTIIINRWDKIICVSQSVKNELVKKFSINSKKISVIPNGIDPKIQPQSKDKSLVKKLKLSGKTILLYLGQLSQRKNVKFLIKVILKLSSNFSLLLVGDGPQKSQLLSEVRQKNLKTRINFTGLVTREEKTKYLNLADIFLYPTKKEGFGLTVLEAMACGKPVICSDIPVLREVVQDKQNGFLLKPNKSKDWVALIKKINKDSETKNRIGERAKTVKQKFTWNKTAEQTIKVYQDIFK